MTKNDKPHFLLCKGTNKMSELRRSPRFAKLQNPQIEHTNPKQPPLTHSPELSKYKAAIQAEADAFFEWVGPSMRRERMNRETSPWLLDNYIHDGLPSVTYVFPRLKKVPKSVQDATSERIKAKP